MAAKTKQTTIDDLFVDHRQTLVWTLRKMIGCAHTAEDLVHEAYLRVATAAQHSRIEFLQPFLYQTAKNLALDHLRKERVRLRVITHDLDEEAIESIVSPLPSLEVYVQDSERVRHLDQALAGLSERRRAILILHKLQGWSYPEIATHLGLSESAVQQNIRHALAHCLAVLKE